MSVKAAEHVAATIRTAVLRGTLKGEISAQDAARKHGLTVAEVEEWRDRFLLGAENALRARRVKL